jgi:hypothetical protein
MALAEMGFLSFNAAKETGEIGGIVFFINAFILWNDEAVVHYTRPLTCGIPRPTQTQASRCGTPSLWLRF